MKHLHIKEITDWLCVYENSPYGDEIRRFCRDRCSGKWNIIKSENPINGYGIDLFNEDPEHELLGIEFELEKDYLLFYLAWA